MVVRAGRGSRGYEYIRGGPAVGLSERMGVNLFRMKGKKGPKGRRWLRGAVIVRRRGYEMI